MSPPLLESASLVETICNRADVIVEGDLRIAVDAIMAPGWCVELPGGRPAVRVGIELRLYDQADEVACALKGFFLLVYRAQPPTTPEDWRELLLQHGVLDAWPLWRAWLHGQLALMDMAPTSLPASPPEEFVSVLRTGLETGVEKPAAPRPRRST